MLAQFAALMVISLVGTDAVSAPNSGVSPAAPSAAERAQSTSAAVSVPSAGDAAAGSRAWEAPVGGLTDSENAEPVVMRRRTGRIVAGSVMTGLGATSLYAGLATAVLSPLAFFDGSGDSLDFQLKLSAGLLAGGAVLVGAGIPTLVTGLKRVPVRSASASATAIDAGLVIAPRAVALNVRF